MIRVLWTIACALLLASCNTPRPHPLIVPDPFQTPLPFLQADQNDTLLSSITQIASITIAPLESEGVLPGGFAEEVAARAQELDVPASTAPGAAASYRLTGTPNMAIASQADRTVNIEIDWQLADARGNTFQEFTTRSRAQFAAAPMANGLFVADDWWRALAAASAVNLRDAIESDPEIAARYVGVTGGTFGPPILVPPVTGAPGDGDAALTRAIRALLSNAEVNVVNPDQPPDVFDPTAAYTLQGQVALGDVLANGGQVIAIGWDLYTADGQHLGNVAQQNLIEPGSLDGDWGETAVYVALAATDGIVELLGAALPGAD